MSTGSGNDDRRVRVAYIDDQLLFREALVNVLEASGLISVVHSSGHERSDWRKLGSLETRAMLIALDMQINDPMATLREVRLTLPDLPICALVAVDRLERAREALSGGCRGAVSTAASLATLIAALETVGSGQSYVDATLGGRLLAKTKLKLASRNNKHGQVDNPSFIAKNGDISKN